MESIDHGIEVVKPVIDYSVKTIDIELEWPPETVAYQITLIGTPIK